jgi:hypothetical protein
MRGGLGQAFAGFLSMWKHAPENVIFVHEMMLERG